MESTANNSISNNPFVLVAAKKMRNLKKKLEKIVKIEIQQLAGKVPDEEQLILLASKQSVERSITDIGVLKAQLEEVAKQIEQEEEDKKQVMPVPGNTDAKLTGEVCIETDQNFSTLLSTASQYEETEVAAESKEIVENVALSATVTNVETTVSTQIQEPVTAKETLLIDLSVLDSKVRKLLKTLHVCLRYKETTSKPLPEKIDFFGKTLLGQTSISGFEDTLDNSTKSAGFYLDDDFSKSYEAIRGLKYSQISDIIDSLANEMETAKINAVAGGAAALFGIYIPAVSAESDGLSENNKPVQNVSSNVSRERGSSLSLDSIISQDRQSAEFGLVDPNAPPPPMGLFHSGGMPYMPPSQLDQLHMMHPYMHQFDPQMMHYHQQYLYSQSHIDGASSSSSSTLAQQNPSALAEEESHNNSSPLILPGTNDSAVQNIAPSSGASVASQGTSEPKVPRSAKKLRPKGRGPPAIPGDIVPSSFLDEATKQYTEAVEAAKSQESNNNLIPALESSKRNNNSNKPRSRIPSTFPISENKAAVEHVADDPPSTAVEDVAPASVEQPPPVSVEVKLKSPKRQRNGRKVQPSPLPPSPEVALDAPVPPSQQYVSPATVAVPPTVVIPPVEPLVSTQGVQQLQPPQQEPAAFQALPPRPSQKRPNRKEAARRNDVEEKQEVPPVNNATINTPSYPPVEAALPVQVQEVPPPTGDIVHSNKRLTPNRKSKLTHTSESTVQKAEAAIPVTVPVPAPVQTPALPVSSGTVVPSVPLSAEATKPDAVSSSAAPLQDHTAPTQTRTNNRNQKRRERANARPVPVSDSPVDPPAIQSNNTKPEPAVDTVAPTPSKGPAPRSKPPRAEYSSAPSESQQPPQQPLQPTSQTLAPQPISHPKPASQPESSHQQQEEQVEQQPQQQQQSNRRQRQPRGRKPRQQEPPAESSQPPAQPLAQAVEPQRQNQPPLKEPQQHQQQQPTRQQQPPQAPQQPSQAQAQPHQSQQPPKIQPQQQQQQQPIQAPTSQQSSPPLQDQRQHNQPQSQSQSQQPPQSHRRHNNNRQNYSHQDRSNQQPQTQPQSQAQAQGPPPTAAPVVHAPTQTTNSNNLPAAATSRPSNPAVAVPQQPQTATPAANGGRQFSNNQPSSNRGQSFQSSTTTRPEQRNGSAQAPKNSRN